MIAFPFVIISRSKLKTIENENTQLRADFELAVIHFTFRFVGCWLRKCNINRFPVQHFILRHLNAHPDTFLNGSPYRVV